MNQIMQQILEGKFTNGEGSLELSVSELALRLQAGECFHGSFTVSGEGTGETYGYVSSTDGRMECLTGSFSGSEETVAYCFHAEQLAPGERVQGAFHIVSNRGEESLPFSVEIEKETKHLFQFAALARNDWLEAVRLFYRQDFLSYFEGADERYYDCYRGLSAFPGNQQNVEEFLIAINGKQRNEYFAEEDEIFLENPVGVAESSLTVVCNGWGYTRLTVSLEGEFLYCEKETVTDDDFLGNRCNLPVYVDSSRLRAGRNFGTVIISSPYQSFSVPVIVSVGEQGRVRNSAKRERKLLLLQLMDCYLSYRMRKTDAEQWMKTSAVLVERLVAMDERDIAARLFQAQLLITQNREEEGSLILSHTRRLLSQQEGADVLWAYYWYLTTLVQSDADYLRQTFYQVEELYLKNKSSWQIAWLLLFLSPEYNRSAAARWVFLEKQFLRSGSSPFLFAEALIVLNQNPSVLRRLGKFELQLLAFGVKHEVLSMEAAQQLIYLAGKFKEASPLLVRILTACYEKCEDVRTLREICVQLIRCGRTDTEAFSWYELGIEKDLRITRLYEYYMMSVDLSSQAVLSKKAVIYFSYQSSLDYEHQAFLYAQVLRHKEEFMLVYEEYREHMEYFVEEQIRKGHINRHLAYLYQELLTPEKVTQELAAPLARLLFAHWLQVENPDIVRIVVSRPSLAALSEYPVVSGGVWVPLYSEEDVVFLEDRYHNRYVKSIPFRVERLMNPDGLSAVVGELAPGETAFDFYLWKKGKDVMPAGDVKQEARGAYLAAQRLKGAQELSFQARQELHQYLLRAYAGLDDMRSMDEYLEGLSPASLCEEGRRESFGYLVRRGMFDRAQEWLRELGPYFAEEKALVKALDFWLEQSDFVKDKCLLQAAEYVYRKKRYDGNILKYLSLHFQSLTRELYAVWKSARSFGMLDCSASERLLEQMLFSGERPEGSMEVFCHYLSQGAKPEVEQAFLAQCCYDDYVLEREQEDFIFQEVGRMESRAENVLRVEKLAFLKWTQRANELSEEQKGLQRQYVKELMSQGLHPRLLKELKGCEDLTASLQDKTIIEFRPLPGQPNRGRIELHYRILEGDREVGGRHSEEMTPVCPGVYTREFILFFGEGLDYFITCKGTDEQEPFQVLEKRTIYREDTGFGEEAGRFGYLDDLMIAQSLEEYEAFDQLLREYHQREYLTERLFRVR